jgi:hypothetical protein
MRGMIAILVIFVMLMQTFSKTIIFASFKINQEYIAKNLCENRNTPEKNCCGKCLLRKQMQKDEQKQDSRLPSSQKNFDEIVLMCGESFSNNLFSLFSEEILFPTSTSKTITPFRNGIFHPPSISC